MPQHGGLSAKELSGDLGGLLGNVRQLQARNRLHGFRAVGGLLDLLQFHGFVNEVLNVLLAQGLAVLLQRRFLLLFHLLSQLFVGPALQNHLVRIVQDLGLDQVLEHRFALLQPCFQLLQWRFEFQGLEWILVVVPVGVGGEKQGQALGKAASVQLAVLELDGVHCSLDIVALEALLSQLLQGLHDELLHFGHIVLLQVLQSHAEGGLQHAIIQAPSNDTGTQAAVDQGLVKRARWGPHHQVVEELQGKAGLEVFLALRNDPVDAHHDLLGDVFILARSKILHDPPGFGQLGLHRDLRIHLDLLELR
mmetsp:Transcript_20996/g.35049  ORF Transcript_20996/g.35049 Transcript_20996/m.35049 type:complete len:307 (-) Transcript_20996:1106-2026(-)